jgi:hypothetical protein
VTTDGRAGPFVSAQVVTEDAPEMVHTLGDVDALCDVVLSSRGSNYLWYAHQGGEQDYQYLYAALLARMGREPEMCVDVMSQGRDRVMGFVVRRGHRRWELRDSYALLPVPLDALVADFAPQACGDWEPVRCLLAVLRGAYRLIEQTFGVVPGWTVGSTGLAAWRATLRPGEYYSRTRPAVEAFCRAGYYGGLSFLTSTARHTDMATLDVNSMYPFVMRQEGVPAGVAAYTSREIPNEPGYYHIRATVPRSTIRPPLAVRDASGVSWPTGTFTTVATSAEITYARTQGVTVDVAWGYTFGRLVYPFRRFVDACETIRTSQPGTARDRLAKMLQANLYGKFGARPLIERYALFGTPPDLDEWHPMVDRQTGEVLPYLYTRVEVLNAGYLHPEWAGWITAQARLVLLRAVEAVGAGRVVYGDTDSLTAPVSALEAAIARGSLSLGTGYGQWKVERVYRWFRAGAPKNYQGELSDQRTRDTVAAIPLASVRHDEHARALDGEAIQTQSPLAPHTLQVLQGAPIAAGVLRRSYGGLDASKWERDTTQDVRPREQTDSKEA